MKWQRFLEGNPLVTAETATIEDVRRVCGARTANWLEGNPEGAQWFFDRDSYSVSVEALKEVSLDVLREIMLTPLEPGDRTLTARDKLKAAETILQLAGAFPSRTGPKVTFLDKEVAKLDEGQVDQRLADLRRRLPSASKVEGGDE